MIMSLNQQQICIPVRTIYTLIFVTYDYYLVMVSTPALEAADGTTKPEPDLA